MSDILNSEARERLIAAGAYDPADERDACGVGWSGHRRQPPAKCVELAIRS